MMQALTAKFKVPVLRRLLLSTGNAQLYNKSYEQYWGITGHDWNAENKLGQLLMQLREEIRNKEGGTQAGPTQLPVGPSQAQAPQTKEPIYFAFETLTDAQKRAKGIPTEVQTGRGSPFYFLANQYTRPDGRPLYVRPHSKISWQSSHDEYTFEFNRRRTDGYEDLSEEHWKLQIMWRVLAHKFVENNPDLRTYLKGIGNGPLINASDHEFWE